MNVTKLLRRNGKECPTCRQPIVEPQPSIVAAGRAVFAGIGLGAALLEYRRALKREAEAAQLARVYDAPLDAPLDEHLRHQSEAKMGPIPPPPGVDEAAWPPAHPSLAAEVDASLDDDADD